MRHLNDAGAPPEAIPAGLDESGRQAANDVAWSALALLGARVVEVYILDEIAGEYIPASVAASGELPAPGGSIFSEDLTAVLPFGRVSVAMRSVASLKGPLGAAAARLHAASMLALRLDRGRRSLGFMLCAYPEPQTFDASTDLAAAAQSPAMWRRGARA
jgi:hypothetical protein